MSHSTLLRRLMVAVAVAGLLPLGASWWWGFELLTHFRVQYVALASLLIVIAVFCRARLAVLALVVAVGINAWPLVPYLPSSTLPNTPPAFDVLNVNVNASNGDHRSIIATLRSEDFDFVSILELTPALDLALHTLADEYPYSYTLPATTNFGIGILSRRPLMELKSFATGRAMAIDTAVALPSGPLRLIAVHLAPPISRAMALERNRALEKLAAYAKRIEEPLLVCGDFNLTPYSPYFARFLENAGLEDARRGRGLVNSWPTFMPLAGIPIDHCFLRGPMDVLSVERLERIGSDHFPMRVKLGWRTRE